MSERRGTVNFEANGKSYALRYDTAALAAAEDHFNMGINAVVQKLQKDERIGDLAQMLAIGTGTDRAEAFTIMDDIGAPAAGDLMGQAIAAAFGGPEGGATSGNGKSRKRTR